MTEALPPLFPKSDRPIAERLEVMRRIAPHLDRLCRRFEDDLPRLQNGEVEAILAEARAHFIAEAGDCRDETRMMAAVRGFRMRVNHAIAVTDFLDLASVDDHLRWLSETAECAVDTTARWLCRQHPDGEAVNDGWFILALGKLGSHELNYSSDIDLIIITLPTEGNGDDGGADYIRLTRRLVAILSQPTSDGIGWRVDLRLRPDPGATPVAIRLEAALSYYESIARTWERSAFIRSRVVAGNRKEGDAFLQSIAPFIWRRYLDYTVLEDMRVMLRREPRSNDCLGFNIKNGVGGIRSVEFFVHVQQLIAGGREPALRPGRTDDALTALAANGWIEADESERLITAYKTWRRLEHRLQMIGDAQTHQLPRSHEQMQAIAEFCFHPDSNAFRRALICLSDQVIDDTASLLERIGPSPRADDDLIGAWLQGDEVSREALIAQLEAIGYREPQNILPIGDGWMAGRIAATRSDRTRTIMARLLPKLLRLFGEQDNPDAAFSHFAQLLDGLPAGVQLLSLLESNTGLASTITSIFASAPTLAAQLARHPEVVDSLMYPAFWEPEHDWPALRQQLEADLDGGRDYEDQLNILRRFRREREFQIATQLLTRTITAAEAGTAFSKLAETVISAIIPPVARHMETRFGQLENGGIAVLALGRLGAMEMTMTSDLDLIFVYDCDPEATSKGPRPISAPQWYARFGQQLINALTAPTAEGRCYDVDMRLRPSGNAGPVAVHLEGFRRYHEDDAWLWEHMALLKARPVAGLRADALTGAITSVIESVLHRDRDPEAILAETARMRARVKAAFPASSALDLRYRDGGLMDLDFLIQMLQLMPAGGGIRAARSIEAIPHLSEAGLLTGDDADALEASARQLNALHQWLRLTGTKASDQGHLPKPIQDAFNLADMAALEALIETLTNTVKTTLEARLRHF